RTRAVDGDRRAARVVVVVGLGDEARRVEEDADVVVPRGDVADVDPLAVERARVEVAPPHLDALVVAAVAADVRELLLVALAPAGTVVVGRARPRRRPRGRSRVLDAEGALLAFPHRRRPAAHPEFVATESLEVVVHVTSAVDEARAVGWSEEDVVRTVVDREDTEAEELPRARRVDAPVRRLEHT